MMTHLRASALVFVLACSTSLRADGAGADDPAALAPADATAFVRLDNVAEIRRAWAGDPLAQAIESRLPHAREPRAWAAVQERLGMSGDEILDRYFGRTVALVATERGQKPPMVLISRIDDEPDAGLMLERLRLAVVERMGAFEIYSTRDGEGWVAVSDRWLMLAPAGAAEALMRRMIALDDPAKTLAADAEYRQWVARVEPGAGLLFARDAEKSEVHAISAVRLGRSATFHYAGSSPRHEPMLERRADGTPEFGPLPGGSTLMAASVNVLKSKIASDRHDLLDALLAPRSFRADVLPHLGAPVLVALGRTKEDGDAVALAVRLSEAGVAADLDRLLSAGFRLAAMPLAIQTGQPLKLEQRSHQGGSYRVADLGTIAAAFLKRAAGGPTLTVSYGPVGEWFVISSSEAYFRQCLEAQAEGARGLAGEAAVALGQLPAAERPIGRAVVRPSQTLAALRRVAEYAPAGGGGVEGRIEALEAMLVPYPWMSLQLEQAEGDYVRGQLHLQRD